MDIVRLFNDFCDNLFLVVNLLIFAGYNKNKEIKGYAYKKEEEFL